jgi:hypothetical protein
VDGEAWNKSANRPALLPTVVSARGASIVVCRSDGFGLG